MTESKVFQYVQLKSLVNPDFWYKLAEIKLDVEKLNQQERKIFGTYSNFNAKNCLIELDCSAFNSEFEQSENFHLCNGILQNFNTIESFKGSDKADILRKEGEKLLDNILSGKCLEDPSLLVCFLLLSFADLKKYNFYYWFAFPTSIEPILNETSDSILITNEFTEETISKFAESYASIKQPLSSFFIANNNLEIFLLKDALKHDKCDENLRDFELYKTYFCFTDPSEYDNAGWLLRNYILMLLLLCPTLHGKDIKIISLRQDAQRSFKTSRIYFVKIPSNINLNKSEIKWTGWERNAQGKLLPKVASMGDSMDPKKIADHFSTLNLKLMKWRLLPNLNLDILRKQRCLLFGAGTLGCSIARNLLSWGINKISFIDCGHVAYSNPVRQSLFTHSDAANNKYKALAAAERILDILPSVQSTGYVLQIPMPGHPVADSMRERTLENISTLVKLIKEHDVLFCITDSRESRWLPTVLGAYFKKIVITTALGFDSYLVMRHGSQEEISNNDADIQGLKCIPGNKLGCYFCNDVTAPGNSTRDRTLDQQCTVTRPGVSNIASAIAVELLVSLLQSKDKNSAPAFYQLSHKNSEAQIPEDILGVIPHSIRGYLSTFSHILPATERFSQCIACSDKILKNYDENGNEFLFKVFESAEYLETVTGIAEMTNDIDNDIIDEFNFDSE